MYNKFSKSIDHFIELNIKEMDYRYALIKEIEPLKSIVAFKKLESTQPEMYKQLQRLIWEISRNTDKYPSFEVLSWELWGYGFDGKYYDVDIKNLEEKLKLIDLLLSTQYWN